jgi:hypothetical protein
MRNLFFFLFLVPLLATAQIQDHKRVFMDTLEYKNFNQGFLDSQEYFKGTGDYFIGVTGWYAYAIPNVVCYFSDPKDRRFFNPDNPNVSYLYTDTNYYNGFKYGATKKKRKRILQGSLTTVGVTTTLVYLILRSISDNNHYY